MVPLARLPSVKSMEMDTDCLDRLKVVVQQKQPEGQEACTSVELLHIENRIDEHLD